MPKKLTYSDLVRNEPDVALAYARQRAAAGTLDEGVISMLTSLQDEPAQELRDALWAILDRQVSSNTSA